MAGHGRLSPRPAGAAHRRARRWKLLHFVAGGTERFVFEVDQIAPVVPPDQRRIENRDQVKVDEGSRKILLWRKRRAVVQGESGRILDLLPDDLRAPNYS